ncbi:MAG: hypothetical protein H6564_13720 [Lewinellaceae bacterium]|nr:hypothetical protein [Lewinellaceae bacterium]
MALFQYQKPAFAILLAATATLAIYAYAQSGVNKACRERPASGDAEVAELFTANQAFRGGPYPNANYSRIQKPASPGPGEPDTAASGRKKGAAVGKMKAGPGDIPPTPSLCMLPLPPEPHEGEEIFGTVEEMPYFPGCEGIENKMERRQCSDREMLHFFYSRLLYPTDDCEPGTIVVQFVVDKTGRVEKPAIVRDIGGSTAEEVLRAIQFMIDKDIRWEPGKMRGRPVNVLLALPLKLCLIHQVKNETKAVAQPEPDVQRDIQKVTEMEPQGTATALSTETPAPGPMSIRLFPNPASSLANVNLKAAPGPIALFIANPSGQVLWRQEYENPTGYLDEEVRLGLWPAGAYVLFAEQQGRVQTQKFIKR